MIDTQAPEAPKTRVNLVLALVVTCQLMIVLDATVVNVALPPMQADLGLSSAGLSWVVNAYTLAFGGLLLLGGRLGDAFGRRRMFMVGISIFTLSSLAGGAAPSGAALVLARAVQGSGAALAAPSALAILLATFAEGDPRNRALGVFSAMSAAGGAIGLLVGGALTSLLSWRWVLFINVPIGGLLMLVTPRLIEVSPRVAGRFDLVGALTSTTGMTALVYGLIRAGTDGWGDGVSTAALFAALLLLAAFVVAETRAEQPLLPLRLFARPVTAGAYLTMLLVPAVLLGMYFFVVQFIQIVLGYSAIETGLAFLPMAVLIFAGSQAVPSLLPRYGPRPFLIAGAAALAAASLWLTQISASSSYFPAVFGPLVLFGLGGGLLFMPLSAVLFSGVRLEDSGAASGAMQAVQQLGGAVGVAILVSTFAADGGEVADPVAFSNAIADAFVAATAMTFVILALVVAVVRPPRPKATSGRTFHSARAPMPNWSKSNFAAIEDTSPDDVTVEWRLARPHLGPGELGVSRFTYPPGTRFPYAHRHREQEEAYLIVAGSGRVKLDDTIVELTAWDVLRVGPSVVRQFEAGSDGLDVICIGGKRPQGRGDGERVERFWD